MAKYMQKLLKATRALPPVAVMVALVLGVILVPRCLRLNPINTPTIESVTKTLKPDDAAKVVVKSNTVITVRRRKDGKVKGEAHYVPPEGSTEITVKKDGTVDTVVRNRGLTFSPGIGGAYSDRGVLVVDAKLAFWGQYSLLSGVGASRRPFVYAAVGYHIYRNTSVFIGVNHRQEPLAGLRVGF